jgi:hypothetical protein
MAPPIVLGFPTDLPPRPDKTTSPFRQLIVAIEALDALARHSRAKVSPHLPIPHVLGGPDGSGPRRRQPPHVTPSAGLRAIVGEFASDGRQLVPLCYSAEIPPELYRELHRDLAQCLSFIDEKSAECLDPLRTSSLPAPWAELRRSLEGFDACATRPRPAAFASVQGPGITSTPGPPTSPGHVGSGGTFRGHLTAEGALADADRHGMDDRLRVTAAGVSSGIQRLRNPFTSANLDDDPAQPTGVTVLKQSEGSMGGKVPVTPATEPTASSQEEFHGGSPGQEEGSPADPSRGTLPDSWREGDPEAPVPTDFPNAHPLVQIRRIAEAIRTTAPTTGTHLPIDSGFWIRWGEPGGRHAAFVGRMHQLADAAVVRIGQDQRWGNLGPFANGMRDQLSALICHLAPLILADRGAPTPMPDRLARADAALSQLRPAFDIIEALNPPRPSPESAPRWSAAGTGGPADPTSNDQTDKPERPLARLLALVRRWREDSFLMYVGGRIRRRDELTTAYNRSGQATKADNDEHDGITGLIRQWAAELSEIRDLVECYRPQLLGQVPSTLLGGISTDEGRLARSREMNELLGGLLAVETDRSAGSTAARVDQRGRPEVGEAGPSADAPLDPESTPIATSIDLAAVRGHVARMIDAIEGNDESAIYPEWEGTREQGGHYAGGLLNALAPDPGRTDHVIATSGLPDELKLVLSDLLAFGLHQGASAFVLRSVRALALLRSCHALLADRPGPDAGAGPPARADAAHVMATAGEENAESGTPAPRTLPEWIIRYFRRKQFDLLKELWGRHSVPEAELITSLDYGDSNDPPDTLRRRVSETNRSLCERAADIGESWTIRERTRGGLKSFFLERQ